MERVELTSRRTVGAAGARPSAGVDDGLVAAVKHQTIEALDQFDMLVGVSRLGVAVSGGADSLALLHILVTIAEEQPLTIVPVYISQYETHSERDLADHVAGTYGLDLIVKSAPTSPAAKKLIHTGKAPCRACAPIRAEALAQTAVEYKLDAVALGHHFTDVVTTLIMNVLHEAKFRTMLPVVRRGRRFKARFVRPFFGVDERDVKLISPWPGGMFDCGMCSVHASERERVRAFVAQTFEQHPATISILRAGLFQTEQH